MIFDESFLDMHHIDGMEFMALVSHDFWVVYHLIGNYSYSLYVNSGI